MVNGACFVRLARALPSTRAFALTGRGALRPPYPGCRSLRSLAPGYKQTRLRRVWDGLQPSPLTPKSARKPSCRTHHIFLRNSHGPWELDSQPLGIELPAAGNNVPSPWESEYQPRALEVPAAGTRSTSRGHSMYQPRVLEVPAAGTRCTSRGHSKYQPPAIELPALGNRIASPWQWHCQPPAIRLPSPVATALPDCVANAGPPPGQSA